MTAKWRGKVYQPTYKSEVGPRRLRKERLPVLTTHGKQIST